MSFLSGLLKPIKSALTAPGTNAAEDARRKSQQPRDIALGTLNTLKPLINDQAGFQARLEPIRQRSVMDLVRMGSPAGIQGAINTAGRQFMGAATEALPMVRARLGGEGAGIGAVQGAEASLMNEAIRRKNDLIAYFASPEGRQAAYSLALQASQFGMPALDNFNQLASVILGTPMPTVGASPLSGIANIAGLLTGGGGFKLPSFGGGRTSLLGGDASNSMALPGVVR